MRPRASGRRHAASGHVAGKTVAVEREQRFRLPMGVLDSKITNSSGSSSSSSSCSISNSKAQGPLFILARRADACSNMRSVEVRATARVRASERSNGLAKCNRRAAC